MVAVGVVMRVVVDTCHGTVLDLEAQRALGRQVQGVPKCRADRSAMGDGDDVVPL